MLNSISSKKLKNPFYIFILGMIICFVIISILKINNGNIRVNFIDETTPGHYELRGVYKNCQMDWLISDLKHRNKKYLDAGHYECEKQRQLTYEEVRAMQKEMLGHLFNRWQVEDFSSLSWPNTMYSQEQSWGFPIATASARSLDYADYRSSPQNQGRRIFSIFYNLVNQTQAYKGTNALFQEFDASIQLSMDNSDEIFMNTVSNLQDETLKKQLINAGLSEDEKVIYGAENIRFRISPSPQARQEDCPEVQPKVFLKDDHFYLLLCETETSFPAINMEERDLILFSERKYGEIILKSISTIPPFRERLIAIAPENYYFFEHRESSKELHDYDEKNGLFFYGPYYGELCGEEFYGFIFSPETGGFIVGKNGRMCGYEPLTFIGSSGNYSGKDEAFTTSSYREICQPPAMANYNSRPDEAAQLYADYFPHKVPCVKKGAENLEEEMVGYFDLKKDEFVYLEE